MNDMKYLLFCLFILSTPIWAIENCAQFSKTKIIDRRPELGPIRDQDSMGWCSAFVAADLLTYFIANKGRDRLPDSLKLDFKKFSNMLSPVGMAHSYNEEYFANYYEVIKDMNFAQLEAYNAKMDEEMKKKGKKWTHLGVVPQSIQVDGCIQESIDNGFCLEKDVPSESFTNVLLKVCAERKICANSLMDLLKFIYDKADGKIKSLSDRTYCDLYDVIKAAYPSIPDVELKKIIQLSSRDEIFYSLTKLSCTRQLKISVFDNLTGNKPKAVSVGRPVGKNEELFKLIDQKLESGIVGIQYMVEVLTSDNPKPEGAHASILVGKRFNPKTCEIEYILRNSWGPTCGYYYKENPGFYSCINSAEFSKPDFFTKLVFDYKKKTNELNKKIEQLKKQRNEVKTSSELLASSKIALEQALKDRAFLIQQTDFYSKGQNETYFLRSKFCADKFPKIYRNPKISCDEATHYLYIPKSELAKSLWGITYIE